jgi:transposase-like protein
MGNLKFPETIIEFSQMFATEQACWDYLRRLRWPHGFACPHCGLKAITYIKTRGLWECPKGHQTSVTAGTIMHKTKTPLTKWFWCAYFMSTKTPGISALQLSRQLKMRYETVYMILQKLRAGSIDPLREQLSGLIEVDETIIGRERGGKRRGRAYAAKKSIVVGAVEVKGEYMGRIRLRKVDRYDSPNLFDFIKTHCRKGSTILTDGFKGYLGLGKEGYRHKILTGAGSMKSAELLPHIHIIFSNLKAFINGTYHGVSAKHVQAYLNEFQFRFNRRYTPMLAFQRLLGISMTTIAPEYKELYQTGREKRWLHIGEVKG